MNSDSEPAPVTPQLHDASFWSANKRRPIFLVTLLIGVVFFVIWMPPSARIALLSALKTQRELIFLLFLFALVTLSLIWSAGQKLDVQIFTLFNIRTYPKWLDSFMFLLTQLGNMLTAFIVALIFFILDYRQLAFEIVFGTLTLWLLVELIKSLSVRGRPFQSVNLARVIGWRERGDSFPSGHTTQIFFMMTLLNLRFQSGIYLALALYAIAFVVGFTRIYVGAHYPRDVIAGIVLGAVWGILVMLIDQYWVFHHF